MHWSPAEPSGDGRCMGVMFGPVRIARTLSVPAWDEKRSRAALEYWMARGFRNVSLDSDGVIRGMRVSRPIAWTSGFREGIDPAWGDIGAGTFLTMLEMSTEADKTVRVQLMAQTWPFRRSGEWEAALFRIEIIELQHLLLGAEMDAGFGAASIRLRGASSGGGFQRIGKPRSPILKSDSSSPPERYSHEPIPGSRSPDLRPCPRNAAPGAGSGVRGDPTPLAGRRRDLPLPPSAQVEGWPSPRSASSRMRPLV